MRRSKKWIISVLVMLALRSCVGPALIITQMITRAFEPGGSCGNVYFPVPNTDLISWVLSSQTTTTFEESCSIHDQCYGTLGKDKSMCDWTFWQDMRTGCEETYDALNTSWSLTQIGRLGCGLQAETYFLAVAEPLLVLTYCNEQYYTRVGSREHKPDPLTALKECGRRR